MALIKVLKVNSDGFLEEHSEAGDSIKLSSLQTANYELTDTKLGNLIGGGDGSAEHNHDSLYALKDLTNLVASPTLISGQSNYLIPSDITFDQGSNPIVIRGKDFVAGQASGGFSIFSGSTENANSGQMFLNSGNVLNGGTGNSGNAVLKSGAITGSGNSGSAGVYSGDTVSGRSGDAVFGSGNSTSGDSGDVYIFAGLSTATRGKIEFDASQAEFLNTKIVFTGSAQKIENLADPTAGTDAVNLQTLQAYQEGLKPKQAVRVATTGPLTLASDFEAGDTIDGITLVAGDRILIKDQASASENGIYVVQASGAPVRSDDFDSLTPIDEINGAYTFVQEGTLNAGKGYVQTGVVATIGASDINFVYFNSIANLVGGDGITISGNDVSVDFATSSGLKFVSGQLAVEPNDFAGDGLVDDGADNLAIDWATVFTIDSADAKAIKASDLASTTSGKGASIIGVEDANGYFTSNNQEGVNDELYVLASTGGGVKYTSTASVGDLVYVSANDTVSKYTNLATASKVVGLVVKLDGALRVTSVDDKVVEGILVGATAGTAYYWDGSGLTDTIPSGVGSHVWQVGIAKNATDLHVEVKFIKKNA